MKLAATVATLVALTGLSAADSTLPSSSLSASSSTSSTQPEPQEGYFAVGGVLGAQRAMRVGVMIEAGRRLDDSPWFLHAMFAAGDSGLSADGGQFEQLRAGAEARGCVVHDTVCAFAGADVGYQYDHAVSREFGIFGGDVMDTEAQDLILVPRLGYEVGRAVKLRSAIEIPLFTRIDEHEVGYAVAGTLSLAFTF